MGNIPFWCLFGDPLLWETTMYRLRPEVLSFQCRSGLLASGFEAFTVMEVFRA